MGDLCKTNVKNVSRVVWDTILFKTPEENGELMTGTREREIDEKGGGGRRRERSRSLNGEFRLVVRRKSDKGVFWGRNGGKKTKRGKEGGVKR